MIRIDPVLETYDALDFDAWSIAPRPRNDLLHLDGLLSPAEVGIAMAVIFVYNDIPAGLVSDPDRARFEAIMAEREELIAPGGLLFTDTETGVRIPPGCCFGLENWRDWRDPLNVWPGHDPSPGRELVGETYRVTLEEEDPASPAVEFPAGDLPHLLTSAHERLRGFLRLAERWTAATAPPLAAPLAKALDDHFEINAPLTFR